jgi:uncharacterized LabA/DUF88 family protein
LLAEEFTTGILITGDSDFSYAVEKAQEVNVNVRLAYFPGSSINKDFLQFFNGYDLLHDEFLERCKL